MNILLLTTHANTGGITSYIITLGRGLVKKGHKVFVVSSGGDCVSLMEAAGICHLKLNIRTKSEISPKLWLNLPTLKNIVRHEKIDVIHAQTRVTQVIGSVLSRLTGVKLISTCHGFFRPRWFRRKFPCWGDGVIAISKPVAKHLKEDFHVPDNRVHMIFNGIDLERFSTGYESKRELIRRQWGKNHALLIGIIARLSDVKGIDNLIKAMPLVLKEVVTAELMIIGQGPQEEALRRLVGELSLETRVHFKNTMNRPDEILPGLDVFVMPSLMEGLGLSVMEAQACGVPVVASKVGGLIDLIEDGKTGYLVAPGDIAQLADRIIYVLRHPQLAHTMTKEARLHIERYFSAELMVRQTAQIYELYSSR